MAWPVRAPVVLLLPPAAALKGMRADRTRCVFACLPLRCADKARDRRTGEVVALKKLRMERERDGEYWRWWVGGRAASAALRSCTSQQPCRLSPLVPSHHPHATWQACR